MRLMTDLRMKRGLSMSVLARKAEMHVSSVSQIEGGRLRPYPGQIKKIADALEWDGSPAALFRETEPRLRRALRVNPYRYETDE